MNEELSTDDYIKHRRALLGFVKKEGLDFEENELSGHLVANGKKGQYWIMDMGWKYLELINPTHSGPKVEKLGQFHNIKDAILFAQTFDNQLEEVEQ